MTAFAATPPPSHLIRVLGFGFLYWMAFLLVLEPGNILRAVSPLDPLQEALRIGGASILGALATPALVALVRRWPPVAPRGFTIAAVGALTVSILLIAASCLLAPFVLAGPFPPFWRDLWDNLAGNSLLLLFPISGMMGIAHVLMNRTRIHAVRPTDTRIAIRSRGSVAFIVPTEIDWIEAQGNYAALHVAGRAHLLRETMVALEARLDPAQFARVSRSALVPLARVRKIIPLANGDAEIELLDGTLVRLSRRYRAAVWERFAAR